MYQPSDSEVLDTIEMPAAETDETPDRVVMVMAEARRLIGENRPGNTFQSLCNWVNAPPALVKEWLAGEKRPSAAKGRLLDRWVLDRTKPAGPDLRDLHRNLTATADALERQVRDLRRAAASLKD